MSLETLMRRIGLSHRISILTAQGVDDAPTLGAFSQHELKGLGIEVLGERVKMLTAAQKGLSAVPLPSKEDLKSFFDKEEALSEYYERVTCAGIDSLSLLGMIQEPELESELDMKPGHRKKLMLKLKERETAQATTPPSTAPQSNYSGVSPVASPTMSNRPKSSTHRLNLSTLSEDDPQPGKSETKLSRSWGLSSIEDVPSGRKSPRAGHSRTSSLQLISDTSKILGTPSSCSENLDGSCDSMATTRLNRSQTTTRAFSTRSPARVSTFFMPDQRPDNSKRAAVSGRRPSQLNDFVRKGYQGSDAATDKSLLVKVFDNGRIKDERGHLLYKVIALKPKEIRDMQIVHNVITRALGWNNNKASIYRQGNDAAGGCEVGKLWHFNGKPITSQEDFMDQMWIIAGTANSTFQNSTGETPVLSGPSGVILQSVGKGTKGTPWADRLSSPEFFTGTQKDKHSSTMRSGRGSIRVTKGPIKARMLDVRKQVASTKKDISSLVTTPTQSTSKQHPYTDPPKSSFPSFSSNGRQNSVKSATTTTPTTPRPVITPPRTNTDPLPTSSSNSWPEGESSSNTDHDNPVYFDSQEDLESLGPKDLESANRNRLKGWKKGALLGRGSFGMVYKGTLTDGMDTAVKIVNLGKGGAPAELHQLIREIRFIEQLEHPHIVKYYGCLYDEGQGQVEIFLQLMTGGSIASLTAKHNGKLPEDLVKKYSRQLLWGLEYLHSRKVVHRDVKGANVLIDTSGDCAIADFGTSKCIDDMVSRTHGCTTMVGTPYWMAPEVITACDDGAYDTKVDVWSVGCTIVEMVTGSPPWSSQHENMWAAIFHIAQSTEPPPLPSDLQKQIRNFLIRCFERNPIKRPSCTELLADKWMES
eukprot:TRINITY_DN22493_c0_g1_i1.p1 TRINITY_DN22493_c0_g1~~TRINITY_DN22493_c0_g1_i1.p1  ORF type:complete len:870 (+),score=210.52 TRINITY_DN22493_c0_g1_i1:208-2817(+)